MADHKGAQDRLHKERALRTEIRELGIKSNKLEEEINRLKLGRGVINEKGGFTLPIDRQIAQAEEEKASIEKEEKA